MSETELQHYLGNGNGAAEKPAAREALEWAGETRAKMVDLKFCDLLGTWQHVTLPLPALDESAFDEGLGFDGSSIRGWQGISESDMLLMPDAGTAALDPFTEAPTISLVCEIADTVTHRGYAKDPRRIARRAEAYFRATGIADTAYFELQTRERGRRGAAAPTPGGVRPVLRLLVRPMQRSDWPAVARIYAEGIATRNATFETEVPPWEAWEASHLAEHRLVAELEGDVAGWAALSPVSGRCCYSGVAENSVYVAEGARGRGVGLAVLRRLVDEADEGGIWTIQTGIFPENEPSVRLHERCGFRAVGIRERIGRLDGEWRDVLLMERRSKRW